MNRRLVLIALLVGFVTSCAESSGDEASRLLDLPTQPNLDGMRGGLFHDFLKDGKYDAAGHPVDAEVFQGSEGCAPTTGAVGDRGIAVDAETSESGLLCAGTTKSLGDGTFALNVRALMMTEQAPDAAVVGGEQPVFEIVVLEGERELATRSVTAADFGGKGVERDVAVNFVHRGDGPVRFEVRWPGSTSARLSYVEVFRSTPRLVVSPASQPLTTAAPTFEISMQDPPEGVSFKVACDGIDLTQTLNALLDSGEGERIETAFRIVVRAPTDRMLMDCPASSRVTVEAVGGGWARETSRVTYFAEPIPCGYSNDDPNAVRVLLTGFEPFPADSDRDNSSKEAVDAYVLGPPTAGIAVMRAVLPVEYDAAPALIEDLMERCAPDVIIGFGQGRSTVDVETIAYNRKDTAAVAGGVPDNRGVVYGGDPIVAGGPAQWQTGLPVDTILTQLEGAGIRARSSVDPGRYVCNNLFYTVMDFVADRPEKTGGFVHLPRIPHVDAEARETLRKTVATVVDSAIRARQARFVR